MHLALVHDFFDRARHAFVSVLQVKVVAQNRHVWKAVVEHVQIALHVLVQVSHIEIDEVGADVAPSQLAHRFAPVHPHRNHTVPVHPHVAHERREHVVRLLLDIAITPDRLVALPPIHADERALAVDAQDMVAAPALPHAKFQHHRLLHVPRLSIGQLRRQERFEQLRVASFEPALAKVGLALGSVDGEREVFAQLGEGSVRGHSVVCFVASSRIIKNRHIKSPPHTSSASCRRPTRPCRPTRAPPSYTC